MPEPPFTKVYHVLAAKQLKNEKYMYHARRRGHRTASKQLMQTLIVCLFKTHFLKPIFDEEKSTEYTWVIDQTCYLVSRGDVGSRRYLIAELWKG